MYFIEQFFCCCGDGAIAGKNLELIVKQKKNAVPGVPTSWRDYTGDYLALQGAGLPVYGVSYINTTPILNYLLLFLKYKYQISILSSHT